MEYYDDFGMDDIIYLAECQAEKFELDSLVAFQYNYKTETENERQKED